MESDRSAVLSGSAISEVAELARQTKMGQTVEVAGKTFAIGRDGMFYRLITDGAIPEPADFSTLDGFAGYLSSEPEAKDCLVHVVSPTEVRALGLLEGQDKSRRRVFARAKWNQEMFGFQFDNYMAAEGMTIALQTCFQPDRGDLSDLRAFCSSIRSTKEAGIADDGVSQTVSAKAGIAAITTVPVKNPWTLAPWRTFPELDQPLSPFVLRFAQHDFQRDMHGVALFRTGNAAWYNEAVRIIVGYLTAKVTQKVIG